MNAPRFPQLSKTLFAFATLAVSLAGCETTTARQVRTVRPWLPDVSASGAANGALPNHRVMILSPISLQQVAPELTLETRSTAATAGDTATGVMQTEDYNVAVSAAERALLTNGWQPISQAVLARAAQDQNLQGGIQQLRQSGGLSLMQVACSSRDRQEPMGCS